MAEAEIGTVETQPQPPQRHPALNQLEKLVGTWALKARNFGDSSEFQGQMTFEWLDGGFFLVQRVSIDHTGYQVKGIEIIGYGRSWDGATSADCTSYFFSNTGDLFTYIYDVDDDTITIWGGERGSPAHFKGTFSPDRNTITGAWQWPGGGYEAVSTRVG